jgi:hypothetical protein
VRFSVGAKDAADAAKSAETRIGIEVLFATALSPSGSEHTLRKNQSRRDGSARKIDVQMYPSRQIRASYTPDTITVYQAYPTAIADPALRAQKFVEPFKRARMTWIKPSFLWMAYRSGWATKAEQERVLAIQISRSGFEWALQNSCLSHFEEPTYASKEDWQTQLDTSSVRIQWDPERDLHHAPLQHRSIQIGLSQGAVDLYVDEWVQSIDDKTDLCHQIRELVLANEQTRALELLPHESPYLLPTGLARTIGAS